jgi:hypothetical protein
MNELGFDQVSRDKIGAIGREHGDTLICTLRTIYGPGFANDAGNEEKLIDVLDEIDERSIRQLLRDEESGQLDAKLAT